MARMVNRDQCEMEWQSLWRGGRRLTLTAIISLYSPPGPEGPPGSCCFSNVTSTGDYLVWNALAGVWTVGNTSVELGAGANSSGLSTVAVGVNSTTLSDYSVAVGAGARAGSAAC